MKDLKHIELEQHEKEAEEFKEMMFTAAGQKEFYEGLE